MASTESKAVVVRDLRPADIDRVVRIDELRSGHPRGEYYARKLDESREATPRISLAAELDGSLVGFMLGRLYYGEFGVPEPTAVIDSIGVHPDFGGKRVGQALMEQLIRNMRSLGVESVRTEVAWDAHDLVSFLAKSGFQPAPRLCLELSLD
jgi:ribosomal protein S18 acetylase RimI-like enzyme